MCRKPALWCIVLVSFLFGMGELRAAPITWTSTNFTIGGDSIVGRTHTAYDAGVPYNGFRSIEARDTDSTSGATLPLPGPTDSDKFGTAVNIENGLPNQRRASSTGSWIGDPCATITTYNGTGAISANSSLLNQTVKTQGVGTTGFSGQFVSTGTSLDLSFDGIYYLLAFAQNSALIYSKQRAEVSLSASLTVQDLTTSNTLVTETLFSDSIIQGSYGITRKDGETFSGTRSIDLTGTFGNDILVTLQTSASSISYAYRSSYDGPYGAAGATATSYFDEVNYAFTSESGVPIIPEPSTLALFGLGVLCLAGFRCGRRETH